MHQICKALGDVTQWSTDAAMTTVVGTWVNASRSVAHCCVEPEDMCLTRSAI